MDMNTCYETYINICSGGEAPILDREAFESKVNGLKNGIYLLYVLSNTRGCMVRVTSEGEEKVIEIIEQDNLPLKGKSGI